MTTELEHLGTTKDMNSCRAWQHWSKIVRYSTSLRSGLPFKHEGRRVADASCRCTFTSGPAERAPQNGYPPSSATWQIPIRKATEASTMNLSTSTKAYMFFPTTKG